MMQIYILPTHHMILYSSTVHFDGTTCENTEDVYLSLWICPPQEGLLSPSWTAIIPY